MKVRNGSALLLAIGLIACSLGVAKASAKPILVSTSTSTRAIALDALTFDSEPFSPTASSILYGSDQNTRIIVFVMNLSLQPGESVSALSADAEDASHNHFELGVEYFAKVPGDEWLSMAILKLDQTMGDVGDVLLQLRYGDVRSNRVRIGIGYVGGGLPDDDDSGPTPARPIKLSGTITVGGVPLADVSIDLGGASTATAVTASNGAYVLTTTMPGDYTLTATKKYYTFTPATITIANLSDSQIVNFTAARDTYSIIGTVRDDEGNGFGGASVMLESSSGTAPVGATTASDGTFSFTSVPAGYDYKITPTNTPILAFSSQNITELKDNAALAFGGQRRKYTISGHMGDKMQAGVSGVSVTLTGAATASATTDTSGNYSFPNLPAGRSYIVNATKPDHFVTPASQTFNLLRDERADFSAIRFYVVSGRVTEGAKGLYGILLSLTGPESVTGRTTSNGSYSLTVTTSGDYTLTPSREQNFYQFSPVQRTLSITDHRSVDFSGALVITGPTRVLEFDGTPMTVDYSFFWPPETNVGHFFWEFWAMPGNNTDTRYMLSDGYGGAHALLFGYNHGSGTHYTLQGNVWNGARPFYFNSDDGPAVGEWGHYAVGWDGKSIITYYDGVPVGKQAFTGPRVSTGWYNGATMLLIGGSDHLNFIGRIAQVRGYEENNPREGSPETSFRPQTVFSIEGQLLSYYFTEAPRVADLSYGYNGVQHNGWPRGMLQLYYDGCDGCPTPRSVIDPTAPNFANANNPGSAHTFIDAAPPTPNGARVFDSFSRNNSTYILNGQGGLGLTEVAGQTWQTNVDGSQPQPFGILGERAVLLTNDTALAWVSVPGSPSMDVRVERTRGAFGSGGNTGLCFRVADKDNFFFASTRDDELNPTGPHKLTVGYYAAGVRTVLASDIVLPSDWMILRVVSKTTGTIEVYADTAPVYSTTNSQNATAGGAGLFSFGPGMGLENRWDNFTILSAP